MRPLHQSSASAWVQCPRLYALTVDRDRDPHFMPFVRGQAIHAGCEAAVEVARDFPDRETQLSAGLAKIRDWCAANDVPADVAGDAANIFAASLAEDSSIDYRRPRGCRKEFVEIGFSLNEKWELIAWEVDAPGAAYSGRIDWMRVYDDRVEIIDFKSAKGSVSGDDLQHDWQGRFYSIVPLVAFPGIRQNKFIHFRLRAGFRVSTTFRRGKPWERITRDYFARVRREIQAAGDISDPDTVRATPGSGCAVCPIREKCPERWAMIEAGAVPEDASPEEIARRKAVFKPVGDAADRELKKLAREGDIPFEGKVYGYRLRKQLVCPLTARAFVDECRDVGLTDAEIDELLPEGTSPTKTRAIELTRRWCRENEEAEDYATVETIAKSSGWLVEIEKERFGAYIPDE